MLKQNKSHYVALWTVIVGTPVFLQTEQQDQDEDANCQDQDQDTDKTVLQPGFLGSTPERWA